VQVGQLVRRFDDIDLRRTFALIGGMISAREGQDVVDRLTVNVRNATRAASAPSAQSIIMQLALRYDVTAEAIIGPKRSPKLWLARQHAYFEVQRLRPWLSSSQIGEIFGGRDHSTILHGIKRHKERFAEVSA